MNNSKIDTLIKEAQEIAGSDYKEHEPTARNHARLQSLEIEVAGELIKTIRNLDAKNSRLQKTVFLLSIVATIAAIIALFK